MHYLCAVFGLLLSTTLPVFAQETDNKGHAEPYPSAELLEFLADFGGLDEQTYNLIEYHALQDSTRIQAEKSNEN